MACELLEPSTFSFIREFAHHPGCEASASVPRFIQKET